MLIRRPTIGTKPPLGLPNPGHPLIPYLVKWMDPSSRTLWMQDLGTLKTGIETASFPPTLQGTPTGMGLYCNNPFGSGVAFPWALGSQTSYLTLRMVFRTVAWTGPFTALFDSPTREAAWFFDTNGDASFSGGGSIFGFALTLTGLTPGADLRYDLVMSVGPNTSDVYVNGQLFSSTGSFFGLQTPSETWYFGSNPSGGTAPNYILETVQYFTKQLSAQEVFALYDPPTRWDLYWVPSTRVVFDLAAAAGGGKPWLYYATQMSR